MLKHYTITVTGKVQGVFYRACTQEAASHWGLHGFVKNQADGSVYIEAEGEEEPLNKLVMWCRIGSKDSKVEEVVVEEGEMKGYKGFFIAK